MKKTTTLSSADFVLLSSFKKPSAMAGCELGPSPVSLSARSNKVEINHG
jgi:hypothetical protein